MGKLGRFACILTPMLLTLASLLCTVLFVIGGTNKSNKWMNDLYLFKLDTRNVTAQGNLDLLPGTDLDNDLLPTGLKKDEDLGLEDFYNIYLWNYCSGTVEGTDPEVWKVTECSKPKASFYFDMIEIFNVEPNEDGKKGVDEDELPDSVTKVNKAIKVVSSVMIAMFCCGLVATVITFIVGWFGLLSRWGSCVTTIFADVAFCFLFAGSIIATALYATLREGFNRALDDFGAKATLNVKVLTLIWIAVGFSFAGAMFWMFSTCCCSGRSKRIMGTSDRGSQKSYEKAPYTYERVAAPYAPTTQVSGSGAQQPVGYEPYRHAGAQ